MACPGAKTPQATRHRVFTLFQAANIFDASRRSWRESQVFFDSLRCWLLRHPAQDIQTLTSELWNVGFNGFWQGKIRISQAALPIRWKPLRLSPIHNMLWDSAPSGNSGLRCNAWETYVDYVSRSYQIEECRISSSTKSKLIHLGNRRSLPLQKSLPKSHCPESIWRSCPNLIETTKTPRSSAVPMSQKVLHLPWSSCWWRKWKTQVPRRKKGNNFGNDKNLKNCDTHRSFLWSFVILHNLCVFLWVCHRFSAECGKPGGLSGCEIGIDPRVPGCQDGKAPCVFHVARYGALPFDIS